ncbi:hypothetical protein [Desulfonema ishimotonii]|uniref:hypothetical protein n=1 Tax=Desulfonema ishimotonii TaxID=45657 RepID=UPI001407EA5A|nr:hypothetical protein [Desulfonema ishimotonii]
MNIEMRMPPPPKIASGFIKKSEFTNSWTLDKIYRLCNFNKLRNARKVIAVNKFSWLLMRVDFFKHFVQSPKIQQIDF